MASWDEGKTLRKIGWGRLEEIWLLSCMDASSEEFRLPRRTDLVQTLVLQFIAV